MAQLKDDLNPDFEVVTAESGEEAVEWLLDPIKNGICFGNQFDLIVTDLLMPGMSGYDLADFVRKRNRANKHTPVILLTTEKVDKQEARKHGCAAYFSKTDKLRLLGMVKLLMSL